MGVVQRHVQVSVGVAQCRVCDVRWVWFNTSRECHVTQLVVKDVDEAPVEQVGRLLS